MSPEEQLKIIKRNTVDFISDQDFIEKLKDRKQLNIKLGVDPSRPDLHLGHAVVLRKLREFQDLGHKVTLIIGDFTARIGDPSGRSKTRPMLSKEETFVNAESYKEQAFRILDINKTNVRYNSEWLEKMNFEDVIRLASKYTVARMLERDDFEKRYKDNQPISVTEFLYPLAQGQDSVVIESDVEIGGTDQLFNLLVGRKLQEENGQKPQCVLTMPLIEGTDGHLKMSKSYDNYIGFTESSRDIFGKIMSVPDSMIIKYMKLLTDIPEEEIKDYEKKMGNGEINPRDVKMLLGRKIVELFYDEGEGEKAQNEFINIFRKKDLPDEIPEIEIKTGSTILEIVNSAEVFSSNSEAKRNIQQGGIKIDDGKFSDFSEIPDLKGGEILKIGKRKFFKIVIKN